MVPPQIIDGRSYTLVDLDLLNPWIALNIEDAIACEQIVIKFLCAANVQDRVGVAIKLSNLFQR